MGETPNRDHHALSSPPWRFGPLSVVAQLGEDVGECGIIGVVDDPVSRLLGDARVLASPDDLGEGVANRVVPGFCRAALEAACIEAVRRRRLGRGDTHVEVETALGAANTLNQKAALAFFDDPARGGEVLARCNMVTRGGADAFQQSQKGTHRASQVRCTIW